MNISTSSDYKNVLMLSYYKNGLVHIFFLEALISVVLLRFGQQLAVKEGIALERVW